MSEKRNALAELAKRLNSIFNGLAMEGYSECGLKDIESAQRIVAELAKVSDGYWDRICDGPDVYICKAGDLKIGCCIGRCRAIAEEGSAK